MSASARLKEGIYRGLITLNESAGTVLPFNFEVKYKGKKPLIIIRNADERIVVDEVVVKGDSVNFKMPVFDTEFRTKINGKNLEGLWLNHYRQNANRLAFKAVYGESRRFLDEPAQAGPVFEGRWECSFSPGNKDSSKAVGIFHHVEQSDLVYGTFLTETGDYRYLEGVSNGKQLQLSCFDGSHAFLFTADLTDNSLQNGHFYSGAHWQENWTALRNANFRLRKAEEITSLKDKATKLAFAFPSTAGNSISLDDEKFRNKPVIVQLMGSWCPNCMDESVYLTGLYGRFQAQGLEIIGLAFEKTTEPEKARQQVLRMKNRLGIPYDILITQKTGKGSASETFPMLSGVSAFPTTLFLNRQHEVVRIHTGFSGPATGDEYQFFMNETESLVRNLLKE